MEVLAVLGILLLLFVLVIYNSFAWGFVAKIIAGWYIIPLFPQFPDLTILQYAGIMFFIGCLVHSSNNLDIKSEYREESYKTFIRSSLKPWLLLLAAWLLHLIY